jgi:transcriptional regulator with XRE-family HTH domain
MESVLSNPDHVERTSVRSASSVDAYVGSHIRVRRITLGMTAKQLGDQIGASFQQVFNYERGRDKVSASRLYQIATVLGEHVEFFFGDLIPRKSNDRTDREQLLMSDIVHLFGDETGNQSDVLELIRCYLRIGTARKRHAVLHLVKVLASDP